MELGDDFFMKQALKLAIKAAEADEVPIGAVVVYQNQIIGKGHNQTRVLNDCTAHAEMLALTAAFNYINSSILDECTLFVTVEPCAMCAGAIKWARLGRVVFGAAEPKSGFSKHLPSILHPKTKVEGGVMQEECSQIMTAFFAAKRAD
ncbi:MAG: tRNA(adenine34) deaminase [Bacteroidia bacterium]|jgi:tRNA(adenine34) deaminase